MTHLTNDHRQLEIWMDGTCELCRRSRDWCEQRDSRGRFEFRDFRTADEHELPMDRAVHEASMLVRTGDGEILEGFEAWRQIMRSIPRWRFIATIAGLPPFSWVGPAVYRMIARFRTRLV